MLLQVGRISTSASVHSQSAFAAAVAILALAIPVVLNEAVFSYIWSWSAPVSGWAARYSRVSFRPGRHSTVGAF